MENTMGEIIKISEETEAMMQSIIDVQKRQGKMIEELSASIIGIRDTMMTNLRFELHDMMMEDIVKGYTTQDNYDRISAKFHDYINNLKGNHGIEILYEKYDKLPIK